MSIEFMFGATAFALINLAIFIMFGYLFFRAIRKIYDYPELTFRETLGAIKFEVGLLALLCLFPIFFGSVALPKMSIDTMPDRDLIEYQENTEEVIIVTPPPRSEKLDGFKPLKVD